MLTKIHFPPYTDRNPPDLKTARDMEKFVGNKRQGYRKRLRVTLINRSITE